MIVITVEGPAVAERTKTAEMVVSALMIIGKKVWWSRRLPAATRKEAEEAGVDVFLVDGND